MYSIHFCKSKALALRFSMTLSLKLLPGGRVPCDFTNHTPLGNLPRTQIHLVARSPREVHSSHRNGLLPGPAAEYMTLNKTWRSRIVLRSCQEACSIQPLLHVAPWVRIPPLCALISSFTPEEQTKTIPSSSMLSPQIFPPLPSCHKRTHTM